MMTGGEPVKRVAPPSSQIEAALYATLSELAPDDPAAAVLRGVVARASASVNAERNRADRAKQLHASGHDMAAIAGLLGVTRQRAHQLVHYDGMHRRDPLRGRAMGAGSRQLLAALPYEVLDWLLDTAPDHEPLLPTVAQAIVAGYRAELARRAA